MDPRVAKEVSISNLFDQFIEASTMRNVLSIHHRILNYSDLNPCEFNVFFPRYKRAVTSNKQRKNWKAKALFSKIDKRAAHKCYSNTKTSSHPTAKARDISENSTQDVPEDCINSNYCNNNALQSYNCLVIGSGPAGLRTAIELQLLGASKVCIVEKRSRFSRNNVLHLWPFVIDDLKSLGAKKFYGKFCAGSIDHISIRQLQLILLKVCLMVGCDFRDSCSYMSLCPNSINLTTKSTNDENSSDTHCSSYLSCEMCENAQSDACNNSDFVSASSSLHKLSTNESDVRQQVGGYKENASSLEGDHPKSLEGENDSNRQMTSTSFETPSKRPDNLRGARAHFESDYKMQEKELHSYQWDIIIGADGRRNTLSKFFPRKEFRGRLAIAITANFINRQTQSETSVPEISGLSFIYNQDMFNALACDTNIQLENICYYKDDTHYFVMTAKKRSLLERGVLKFDCATTQDLLSESNIDKEALLKYAKDAACWTTGLEPLDFALNHYGQEDCAMFDFTSMYAASNACKALRTKSGGLALVGLVGDSLLEPFWPTGSGCARGFLSSFDAAWMCRQWAVNKCAVINYHGSTASRSTRKSSDRQLNASTRDNNLPKMVISPTTYDRMTLSVMAERESIYRILAQTTSENLQQNYSHWTLNPHTRYPNLNRHLVMPAQVEHLLSDGQIRVNLLDNDEHKSPTNHSTNVRRVKSPNSVSPRKSPKKLKSAGASPQALAKNMKNRSKSLSRYYTSKSRQDLDLVDSYLEFEESYHNLADSDRGGLTQYLNYRHRDSALDDLFVPSLSGTLPSSNNLSHLEAKRARDIDDCLRQRRQKTKINFVRDQLINQFRNESGSAKSPIISGGNAVLFNEIKRLREQQSANIQRGESKPKDVNGPLSLLNSMRRCASFAERVKSFENKLVQPSQDGHSSESNSSTPRTPIDNVRNLPQFATLQELMVNSSVKKDTDVRKSRIPIAKLSKEDWNVKCWENNSRQMGNVDFIARSHLGKAASVDSAARRNCEPKKAEVFQGRIKEMAEKLKVSKESDQKLSSEKTLRPSGAMKALQNIGNNTIRSQGWINHLKRELVKGSSDSYGRSRQQQPMNPLLPNKPIKKLFDDDDDDNLGIDMNKHYDHLCINRPTNKYLSKGAYSSHLARPKFDSKTSTVINHPNPTAESKRAYIAALTSRGSSASSTLSDYSTNTGNSSSGSTGQQHNQTSRLSTGVIDVDCARCKKFVSTSDRITIGRSTLHRICLTCASCQLTLRLNEIQHYLDRQAANGDNDGSSFLCAICQPEIRAELNLKTDERLAQLCDRDDGVNASATTDPFDGLKVTRSIRLQSREEFLNTRINYNELYKNILPATTVDQSSGKNDDDKQNYNGTPSPIQVTLPMRLVKANSGGGDNVMEEQKSSSYVERSTDTEFAGRAPFSVASRETVNGDELVTLILRPPSAPETGLGTQQDIDQQHQFIEHNVEENASLERDQRRGVEQQHNLIDEEVLHRILHLDNSKSQTVRKSSNATSSSNDPSSSSCASDTDDEDDDEAAVSRFSKSFAANGASTKSNDQSEREVLSSDDSSSLDLPLYSSDDFDDDDDGDEENVDPASTCQDFVTSEEFDATPTSDKGLDLNQAPTSSGSIDDLRARSNNDGVLNQCP